MTSKCVPNCWSFLSGTSGDWWDILSKVGNIYLMCYWQAELTAELAMIPSLEWRMSTLSDYYKTRYVSIDSFLATIVFCANSSAQCPAPSARIATNEKGYGICNDFIHWLGTCSAIGKMEHFMENGRRYLMKLCSTLYPIPHLFQGFCSINFQPLVGVNTLRPRQNGRHFPDDIFKCIFLNENVWISIKISLNFVPKGPINNISPLVQIIAWRRPGDKPWSEPMMVSLLTHICVTRPQWVNIYANIMIRTIKGTVTDQRTIELPMFIQSSATLLLMGCRSHQTGWNVCKLRWQAATGMGQQMVSDVLDTKQSATTTRTKL